MRITAVNVIVDVAGYVPAASDYVALTPARLARHSPDSGGGWRSLRGSGCRSWVVCRSDAKAVVANVTVVGAAGAGFVTVFPCGTLPGTSSVNYSAVHEAVANEVIVKLSPAGSICVYAHTAVNVVIDVAGHL